MNYTSYCFDTVEYVYYNDSTYIDNSLINLNIDSPAFKYIINNYITFRCTNIQLLKYCAEIVKNYNIILETNKYRILPRFPLNILEEYTNKFYKPNNLYLCCDNDYIERFVNSVFSDTLIKEISKYHIYGSDISDVFEDYEIFEDMFKIKFKLIYKNNKNDKDNDNKDKNTKNKNDKNNDNKDNRKKIKYEKLYTKDIIIKKYDLNNFYSINSYNIVYDDIDIIELKKIYELSFIKKYLNNYNELDKILYNPEYVVNMNYKTNINVEYIIMKFTYIISLIHNKTNNFIIHVLLNYYNIYNIKYKNNLLLLDIHSDKDKKFKNIFFVLSGTPHKIFNKYVHIDMEHYEI